jgi:glycosyltransferase involved in cell wall biosynthesis
MRICHLLFSPYHGTISNYEGSITQIAAELFYGQKKMGHDVFLLDEFSFLKSHSPWGDPFDDKLKEFDIIACHEYNWLKFIDQLGLNYVHIMHGGCTLNFKNHISPTDFFNKKEGGRARIIPFGISPERIPFSEKKDNEFIHFNTFSPKKGLLEILNIIGDYDLKIFGGIGEDLNYTSLIKKICNQKTNIDLNLRWILNEEKYKILPFKKAMLLAHIEEKGPESFCMTQIESMFTGTPVVAFGRIFKEVSKHGVTSLITEKWDEYKNFLNNISDIDPFACRKYAEDNFNADLMNERHLVLYEKASNGEIW